MCVDNDPVFIIMELMPAADLLKFLREARPESVSNHQLYMLCIIHIIIYTHTFTCTCTYRDGRNVGSPLRISSHMIHVHVHVPYEIKLKLNA